MSANAINETVDFFLCAFEGADPAAVRDLVVRHTDARGRTNQDAVMAGMEALAAPQVQAPKRRERTAAETAANTGALSMVLRPCMDGGCVGTLTISADALAQNATAKSAPPRLCFCLDRSGSMGASFQRLLTAIVPAVCARMGVPAAEEVSVICFDHTVQAHKLTMAEMRRSTIAAGGRTYMAPAIQQAMRVFMADQSRNVRFLVLSDGELHDQEETLAASTALSAELRQTTIRVNSQAVRFFTSTAQPDTRGLASVLALNSVGAAQLIDLSASMSDEVIIDAVLQAFEHDGLDVSAFLEADDAILLANPWDATASKQVALKPGANYVWFKRAPVDLRLKGTNVPVNFEVSDQLALDDLSGALKPLMDSYVARLKVLKVVNTPGTIAEIKAILDYFERFDTFMQSGSLDLGELLANRSIRARLEYFRAMAARRRSSLFGLMSEVANDDKVAKLSAAQQADYLRQVVGDNRNAKALARRALGQGLDFAATLHAEVRAMRARVADELGDVDDREHAVSFYSMESTLGGIRALCSLDDALLEEMEATDILQIANIVGVPCNGPIGNFVDPMTWRCDKILPGVHLSLSDILVAHVQSRGKSLTAPGHPDVEVTNVIPVFDDPRVFRFLKRHAPTLLEYTASIGMRRVLAEVPHTYSYTLAAGLWKMVEVLSGAPTEGNVRIFQRFAEDFHAAIGGHFDYVLDSCVDPAAVRAPALSFWINNNGITNMIDPILQLTNPAKLLKDPAKHAAGAEQMPRILRAIYSFETYQVIRRLLKREEQPEPFIEQQLHALLGVDLTQHATPLQPLFTAEPKDGELAHHSRYAANAAAQRAIAQTMWYVDYLALLPAALACVARDDPLAHIRENFRAKAPDVVCQALGLEVHSGEDAAAVLARFQLANIVQAFLYPSKADRVDDKAHAMRIADVGPRAEQERLLSGYVAAQYANQYRKDAVAKAKAERREIVIELIRRLMAAPSMAEFCDLLQSGLKRGHVADVIKDVAHAGFVPLKAKLLSLSEAVPLRVEKLTVLALGHDDSDQPVFNGGNVMFKGLEEIEDLFAALKEDAALAALRAGWKKHAKHTYRTTADGADVPNHHSHCNSKVSYFGLGYPTLEAMAAAVAPKQMKEYERVHWNCCGIPQLKGLCWRRKERLALPDSARPAGAPASGNNASNAGGDDDGDDDTDGTTNGYYDANKQNPNKPDPNKPKPKKQNPNKK